MIKRRGKYLNLNPLSTEFKKDLQKLFDSSSDWKFSGEFTEFLKKEGILNLKPNTVYKYLNSTSLPFEVGIHLLSFLAREPYVKKPEVKRFIQKWAGPINQAIEQVKKSALKEKEALIERAKEFDQFLS